MSDLTPRSVLPMVRAYVYEPVVSRAQVVSSTMRDIIDRLFGGSAESLVLGLVETKHLTPKRLAKLQAALEAGEAKKERTDGDRG